MAVELLGGGARRWQYRLAGAPDQIVVANVRWLAGYRHLRHELPAVAGPLREVFAEPYPLMAGAEQVGDPIGVLPVLFHLLWRHELHADLSVPLHPDTVVRAAAPVAGGRAVLLPGRPGLRACLEFGHVAEKELAGDDRFGSLQLSVTSPEEVRPQ